MEEYRVEIKVKNNNILKKIEQAGYKTVGEFCRKNNLMARVGTVGEIINLKQSPLNSKGEFRPIIYQLSTLLNCIPEELFSDIQMNTALETNKRTIQVNEAEMRFMLENQPDQKLLEDIVAVDEQHKAIEDLLYTLTPREQKVLIMRFGLQGRDPVSLTDTAAQFDVTRERIRQIEAKALRKLRHPSRCEKVREFY